MYKDAELIDVESIHADAFREHFQDHPELMEGREDFATMQDFLATHKTAAPIVGKQYAYLSIQTMPVMNYINVAHFDNTHTLVNLENNYAYFDIDGDIKRVPESSSVTGDLLSKIYFFNTTKDLAHFDTLMRLKFVEYKIVSKVLDQQVSEEVSRIKTLAGINK